MDKFEAFKPDEETIESWLDALEARLLCHNVTSCDKKRHWCQALVGEAGRNIIRKLPSRSTWGQIKAELISILGEPNPKDRAFDQLLHYQPKGKGLGEIATDIITKANKATDDIDAQHRLGLKAFLSAVPASISRELRRKHFSSVKEALDEARFLQRVEEEEKKETVFTVGSDETPPPPSQKDLVEECIRQLHSKGMLGEKREQPNAKRKASCWCCGEEGHFMMQCPTVSRNKAAQNGAARKKPGNE